MEDFNAAVQKVQTIWEQNRNTKVPKWMAPPCGTKKKKKRKKEKRIGFSNRKVKEENGRESYILFEIKRGMCCHPCIP